MKISALLRAFAIIFDRSSASPARSHSLGAVVVYKVDRLTRPLTDFAKLVEVFDAHGVPFVASTRAARRPASREWFQALNLDRLSRSVRGRSFEFSHRRPFAGSGTVPIRAREYPRLASG